jgi:hypothetical protein
LEVASRASHAVAIQTVFVIASAALVLLIFADKPDQFPLMMVGCCLLGVAAFAALPTGLELCVEVTYPINEGLSTSVKDATFCTVQAYGLCSSGFIWIASQALGVVLILASNALKGEEVYYDDKGHALPPTDANAHKYNRYPKALYMFAGVTGLATISILSMQTRYKRLEAERGAVYDVTIQDESSA